MHIRSDFFKILRNENWWWVRSQNPKAKVQLEEFDGAAYVIERSSNHNKEILHAKLVKIINHISPLRTGPVLSHERQQSLKEFCVLQPNAKDDLENAYAEYTNYVSIFSEIRVFNELIKLGFQKIEFLEEESRRKTPDFKVTHNGLNILVEVKCINPPKEEEQRMMARIDEFVELNTDFLHAVVKKLRYHLENAKAKFGAVGAYGGRCKRWVYASIIWGVDAKFQGNKDENPDELITSDLIQTLEREFGVEIKIFKTFAERMIMSA